MQLLKSIIGQWYGIKLEQEFHRLRPTSYGPHKFHVYFTGVRTFRFLGVSMHIDLDAMGMMRQPTQSTALMQRCLDPLRDQGWDIRFEEVPA